MDESQTTIERLQEIMTALMEKQLTLSLEQVDKALGEWKKQERSVFEAHAELLRHAAQAERLAGRMARIGLDNAGGLLRDAFDAGLIDADEFLLIVGKKPEEVQPSPPLSESGGEFGVPDKRELVEEFLTRGPILIHVNALHALAQVPAHFCEDPKLVLRFGYDLSPAIIDLSIDDDGIYGTLTFGGVPTRCVLPWSCIYSVVSEVDQQGMVWPEDVPDSVVEELESTEASKTEEKDRPGLHSVALVEDVKDEETKPPPAKPPRNHLTLVK